MHDNMVISFFVAGATVFHYMDYPACIHIQTYIVRKCLQKW